MKEKNLTLQWIKKISKPVIPVVVLISILGILNSLCSVFVALQSKNVIDFAVSKNGDELIFSVAVLILLIALQFVISLLYMRYSANAVAKHSLNLQKNIFAEIMGMKYKKSVEFHTGELLNRITADSDIVMCAVIGIIPSLVAFVTGIFASFCALFVIQPMFALTCVAVGVLVGAGAILWGRRLKRVTLECRRWADKSNSFMLECIQNLLVIKSFCNENKVVNHAQGIQNETYKSLKKRNINNIFATLASEFVFTFGYFLALGWGAFGILSGSISYGNLMAMVQLVGKIQSPFKGVASVVPQYYQMLASAERLIEVVNSSEDYVNTEIKGDFESVIFKDVSFGYNEDYILKDADLEINKGDFILISGISGIGKSTLLKLILAMYKPDKGSITVNYSNGETRNLDTDFRRLCSYVPQGNMVLSGTVEENVVFFNEEINHDKIEECLKIAGLWNDVLKMPQGCNTVVGENGLGLSEGQVQRLAVARALYRNTPILLLDESTSALDNETEAEMLGNIKKLNNITCILVSHKKNAEVFMDKKIVISDGHIKVL